MNGKRQALPSVTRRSAVAAFLIAPALAQHPAPPLSAAPPQGVPAPPLAAASPQARRQKAEANILQASEALRKHSIPMELEPDFAFSVLT